MKNLSLGTTLRFRSTALTLGVALLLTPLLVLPTPATSPAGPQEKPPETPQAAVAVAAAQQAIEREDYATAAHLLENFLLEHPGQAEALLNLAYCYTLLGRPADARDTYRQTLEVNPELFSARLNLGLLLLDDDRAAAAATELKQAVQLEPDNYKAHFYAARALARSGEKEQALAHYRRAAHLEPQQPEPLEAQVNLLLEEGELGPALGVLEQWLEVPPNQPSLLRLRADLLLQQKKREEALTAYETYLKVEPEDAAAHVKLGRLYREQGQWEEALQHFVAAEKAPARNGNPRWGVREHAETLAALERWREAIPLYEEVLTHDPDDPDLRAGLGHAYLQERQFEPAIRQLLRTLQLDPTRVEAYNHLASALYLKGNLPATIEILDRRAQLSEETTATLFLRALCYDKLNQCEPAIAYYEKFLVRNADEKNDQYFQATARLRFLKKSCRRRRR